jgi:hypothetical protein
LIAQSYLGNSQTFLRIINGDSLYCFTPDDAEVIAYLAKRGKAAGPLVDSLNTLHRFYEHQNYLLENQIFLLENKVLVLDSMTTVLVTELDDRGVTIMDKSIKVSQLENDNKNLKKEIKKQKRKKILAWSIVVVETIGFSYLFIKDKL